MDLRPVELNVSGVDVTVWGDSADLYHSSLPAGGAVFEAAVALVSRIDDPDLVMIDVGASIGVVSLAASQLLTSGRVVSAEPEPRAAECLRAGVRDRPNVTIVETAVGAREGSTGFRQNPAGTAWGTMTDDDPSIEVPVTTLDRLMAESALQRVDVVKVDVEGFELDVLSGAEELLSQHAPVLIVELNPYCLWRHGRCFPQDLLDHVVGLAPVVAAIGPDGVATDMTIADNREGMLHHLATTGTIVDLVTVPAGRDVDLDLREFVPAPEVTHAPEETPPPPPSIVVPSGRMAGVARSAARALERRVRRR